MQIQFRALRVMIPLLVAILITVSGAPPSLAQDATPTNGATPSPNEQIPLFAIYPKETGPRTFFDIEQKAGTSATHTVVLINAGTDEQGPFTGRTFAVDAHTKLNGGLDSGSPNDLKTGVTTWLDYPNEIFTLEPGTGVERTFTVTVPEGTPPGQYITALCFETAEPLAIEGVENLKQNIRQTIAFYVTVPGEIEPAFSIENIRVISETDFSGIQAEIVNSGNILVRPEGKLTISDLTNTPLLSTDLGFGAFFAGHTGRVEIGLGNTLPAGDYLVTIELRDPETGATSIVENQKVTRTTRGELPTGNTSRVGFSAASAQIRPSVDDPQFLNIEATIENGGEPITDAELSLQVLRDGQLVENYVVVAPLSLEQGATDVSSRYIPLEGWSSGTWTFTLSVQRLNRETGVSEVLSTITLGEPVVIP